MAFWRRPNSRFFKSLAGKLLFAVGIATAFAFPSILASGVIYFSWLIVALALAILRGALTTVIFGEALFDIPAIGNNKTKRHLFCSGKRQRLHALIETREAALKGLTSSASVPTEKSVSFCSALLGGLLNRHTSLRAARATNRP